MLITLASVKGAPGTTTTALALATHWPRPVILVEADLAGSSIIPGYLRGQIRHDRGVHQLAIAHHRGSLEAELGSQLLPLDAARPQGPQFLPGLFSASSSPAARELWGPLASHLAGLGEVDTLVDLGRIDPVRDDREVFVTLADLALVVTSSRLPDWWAARQLVSQRTAQLGGANPAFSNLRSLVVGPGRPYSAGDVAGALGAAAVDPVEWDPVVAAAYSDGTEVAARTYAKSAFTRSVHGLIASIEASIAQRRGVLTAGR